MKAPVNKIIPFSAVDGPGNRTALFLQGCNYNCQYCHNPETIHPCNGCGACLAHCPTGAITQGETGIVYDHTKCVFCDACFAHCSHNASPRIRWLTPQEAMDEVSKNLPFVRGLTVSGGECTLWPQFLLELATLAKAKGLNTLLDSNGGYDFSQNPALLNATDGVMLDVKAWNNAQHEAVTGVGNQTVLQNLRFLAQNAKLEEVRTVVCPDLFNADETVQQVANAVVPFLALRSVRYKIIQYRPVGVRQQYAALAQPDAAYLQHLRRLALAAGMQDVVVV